MAGPGPTGGPNRWLPTTSPVLRQSSPGPTTGPGPVPGLDLETLLPMSSGLSTMTAAHQAGPAWGRSGYVHRPDSCLGQLGAVVDGR